MWARRLQIALCLGGVGLFFELIGFVCPGWVITEQGKGLSINMALWYFTSCSWYGGASTCETMSYYTIRSANQGIAYQQIVEWEVLATLAIVFAAAALFLTYRVRKGYMNAAGTEPNGGPVLNSRLLAVACLGYLISGILMLVPVGTVGKAMETMKYFASKSSGLTIGFSYGLMFAGLGASLDLLASLLIIFTTFMKTTRNGQSGISLNTQVMGQQAGTSNPAYVGQTGNAELPVGKSPETDFTGSQVQPPMWDRNPPSYSPSYPGGPYPGDQLGISPPPYTNGPGVGDMQQ